MSEVQVGEVAVNGLRLAYRRAGAGPSLILLHGGPGNSREWRPPPFWLHSVFQSPPQC